MCLIKEPVKGACPGLSALRTCLFCNIVDDVFRWGMGNWLQGLGSAAGPAPCQQGSASSLPGLQVTIPSHLRVYCHEVAASESGIQTSKCWETELLGTPFEAAL